MRLKPSQRAEYEEAQREAARRLALEAKAPRCANLHADLCAAELLDQERRAEREMIRLQIGALLDRGVEIPEEHDRHVRELVGL